MMPQGGWLGKVTASSSHCPAAIYTRTTPARSEHPPDLRGRKSAHPRGRTIPPCADSTQLVNIDQPPPTGLLNPILLLELFPRLTGFWGYFIVLFRQPMFVVSLPSVRYHTAR